MPLKTGTHLGGIRRLDDLKARCIVDEDTHCWTFGMQRDAREPMVWVRDQTMSPGRAAWLLSGKRVPSGRWLTWATCRNPRCCNPAHRRAGTKADHGAWVQASGHLRGRIERSMINRRIKLESGQAKLTQELAEWVRESHQTGVEIAHALAVTPHAVSRVRRGETWRNLTAPASVFSWRP